MSSETFSIVVASPHLTTVGAAVAALLEQDRASSILEIFIAGPCSTALPQSQLIRRLDIPAGPAYAAYNAGIEAANADNVVLLDGDCVLAPDWLTRVAQRHREGWDAVSGGVLVPRGSYWATAYNLAGFSEWLTTRASGPRSAMPTMNLSVRRSVAQLTGPVRDDLPRVYDFDWTLRMSRLGFRLYFDADARATHAPPGVNSRVLWRTWYANGSCSQEIRRRNRELIGYPWPLRFPRLLRALSPIFAVGLTSRVLFRDPVDSRVWAVLPVVWWTRLAWLLGASDGRRRGPQSVADYAYETGPAGRRGFWSG